MPTSVAPTQLLTVAASGECVLMRHTTATLICFGLVSCGFPTLSQLVGAEGDAGSVGSSTLTVTASPSSFDLYASNVLDTTITVTNTGGASSGKPELAVTGLTRGTVVFTSNTCTAELAPGASCSASGHLVEATNGYVIFQISATATPGGTAMASLAVHATCLASCGFFQNGDCCASGVVPGNAPGATLAGASFYRSYDVGSDNANSNMSYPATISDLRIDHYLVTVGRFRAFVNAGLGTQIHPPAAGAGARTLNGMANQGGWDNSFDGNLAANETALMVTLNCGPNQAWTDTPGANEDLPMTCVSWYEAMAFCIWDGGFLPTVAESNYVAAGGSEQRAYPWSIPASSLAIDCTYANYNINVPSGTLCVNGTTGGVNRVGSEENKGAGRWGHADLAGNVFEWLLDWSAPLTSPCDNCANLTPASNRAFRGGAYLYGAVALRGGELQLQQNPRSHLMDTGLRCVRPL